MTRVLLVTGARSLADDPAAEAWARGILRHALVGVDLLIVGDDPGPDAWAWDLATGVVRAKRRYHARGDHAGKVLARCAPDDPFAATWAEWSWAPPGTSTHPLNRNAAMVLDAAYRPGTPASVLALLDGRKPRVVQPGEKRPTRGTEHTVGLARAAGLTVDAQTWGSRG